MGILFHILNTTGNLFTDINTNLSIPSFNSSLGTLESASVSLQLGIQTEWTFSNLGKSSATDIGSSSGNFTINSNLGLPISEHYSFGTYTATVPAYLTTNSPEILQSFSLNTGVITNNALLNNLSIGG